MWWLSRHRQLRSEEVLVRQDTGSLSYYFLLAAAALIATLGILVGNTPVIIGAMLIAPLMVPIMALAVGIAKGEGHRILNSLAHLSMSILVVVLLAFVMAKLVPVADIPDQALLRAQPSIVDLLVAIFSGAVGMYAYLHKDVPESLVGVAISVALVPPLTVIGVGFALGAYLLSLGATVLFFTNVVAIVGAAVVVLFSHGRSAGLTRSEEKREVALASGALTLVIGLTLAILLGSAFFQVYREDKRKVVAQDTLTEILADVGGKVTELEVDIIGGQVRVAAVVRVPDTVEKLDIEKINNDLVYALEQSVDLQLSLIRVQQATRELGTGEQAKIQEIKTKTQTDSFSQLEQVSSDEAQLMRSLGASESGQVQPTEAASISAGMLP